MTFALNHLSYFLLTNLLLPLLEAERLRALSASRLTPTKAHRSPSTISKGKIASAAGKPIKQSKLANILFTSELVRRLEGKRVTANTLHPGFVRTTYFPRARSAGLAHAPRRRCDRHVAGRRCQDLHLSCIVARCVRSLRYILRQGKACGKLAAIARYSRGAAALAGERRDDQSDGGSLPERCVFRRCAKTIVAFRSAKGRCLRGAKDDNSANLSWRGLLERTGMTAMTKPHSAIPCNRLRSCICPA